MEFTGLDCVAAKIGEDVDAPLQSEVIPSPKDVVDADAILAESLRRYQ
jgi:hypothetical protein